MIQKDLPNNFESELAVLSCCLQGKTAQTIRAGVKKEWFYDERNKYLFEIIEQLALKGVSPDTATVFAELRARNKVSEIDLEYLNQVYDAAPSPANVEFYIEAVKSDYGYRSIQQIALNTSNAVESARTARIDPTVFSSEIISQLHGVILESHKTEPNEAVIDRINHDLTHSRRGEQEKITGIKSYVREIDKYITSFRPGSFTIIAARPGEGKSALLAQIMGNNIERKKKCLFFSMEMSKDEVWERIIQIQSRVSLRELSSGVLKSREEWDRYEATIAKCKTYHATIEDSPNPTTSEIYAIASQLQSEEGLDAIFIDYIQLIQGRKELIQLRERQVSDISASLKAMAMKLNLPVIAAAQLNRYTKEMEKPRGPRLTDLRESGSLEQDANNVILLWHTDRADPSMYQSEIIVAKQRGGPSSEFGEPCLFNRPITSFESLPIVPPNAYKNNQSHH